MNSEITTMINFPLILGNVKQKSALFSSRQMRQYEAVINRRTILLRCK